MEIARYGSLSSADRVDRLARDLFDMIDHARAQDLSHVARRSERLWYLLGLAAQDEAGVNFTTDDDRLAAVRPRLAHLAGYVWYHGILPWGGSPSRAQLEKLSIELIAAVWRYWVATDDDDKGLHVNTLYLRIMSSEMERGSRHGEAFAAATRQVLGSLDPGEIPRLMDRLTRTMGC